MKTQRYEQVSTKISLGLKKKSDIIRRNLIASPEFISPRIPSRNLNVFLTEPRSLHNSKKRIRLNSVFPKTAEKLPILRHHKLLVHTKTEVGGENIMKRKLSNGLDFNDEFKVGCKSERNLKLGARIMKDFAKALEEQLCQLNKKIDGMNKQVKTWRNPKQKVRFAKVLTSCND